MADQPLTITLGDATYPVVVPRSFADRESIYSGIHAAGKSAAKTKKLCAATVAMCVPAVAAMVGTTLDDCDDDFFRFGKAAYDALRDKGIAAQAIYDAGFACFRPVAESLAPRADEVKKAEVFSAAGAPPT